MALMGQMMQMPLLISSLIKHAARHSGDTEIVSKRVEGDVHRYTWADAERRSRQVAQALARLGLQPGDRVATLADVPGAVARYLDGLALPRRAVAWTGLGNLPWAAQGVDVECRPPVRDPLQDREHGDLVGITGCFVAIAETGSLMLLSGPDTFASAALLPETHIAVVPVSRIEPNLEAAFARLRAEHGQLPRATNIISGPSRTGDIEQTIVLGAHGPYRVHVILVDQG